MGIQGGFGVVFEMSIASVMTPVAHITEVKYPKLEKEIAEVTAHDSPGGYAEHIATGKFSLGELTFTLAWDGADSTHSALLAAYNSKQPVDFSIHSPDNTDSIAFSALVKSLEFGAEQDGFYQCEVTLQPTGQPTIT